MVEERRLRGCVRTLSVVADFGRMEYPLVLRDLRVWRRVEGRISLGCLATARGLYFIAVCRRCQTIQRWRAED
jgi:hypothetical protein